MIGRRACRQHREVSLKTAEHRHCTFAGNQKVQVADGVLLAAQEQPQRIALYRRALALYGGDYLPENLYQDWVAETRERLQRRYLNAATQVAELLLESEPQEAIRWCETVLAVDPCWEEAYRPI